MRGPADRHPRGLLGGGLDRRRADRLPRHPELRRTDGAGPSRSARCPPPTRSWCAGHCPSRRGGWSDAVVTPTRRPSCGVSKRPPASKHRSTRMPPPRHPSPHRPCPSAGQRLAALWTREFRRADGVPLARVVLRELLLLRSVHLDPDDPRGGGVRPGALLRIHPDHHARPAARLRRRRVAHRGLGTPPHAVGVPRRIGGGGRVLRHRDAPRSPSSSAAWRCRSSTWARGARCTPSHPRCTRRRCGPRGPGGRPASDASPRSARRCRCRSCSLLGGAPLLFVVFAVFFLAAAGAAWGLVDRARTRAG